VAACGAKAWPAPGRRTPTGPTPRAVLADGGTANTMERHRCGLHRDDASSAHHLPAPVNVPDDRNLRIVQLACRFCIGLRPAIAGRVRRLSPSSELADGALDKRVVAGGGETNKGRDS